jgi:iron complex transport system substrate-binding protein
MRRTNCTRLLFALLALVALIAAGCGDDDGSSDDAAPTDVEQTTTTAEEMSSDAAAWPVEIEHAYGTTTIEEQPQSVASASVSMTGHLLSVDALVVASMTTSPDSPISDENGFFVQWSEAAVDGGVEAIAGPEINVEAIAAADPDLIVGSAVGGDAVDEQTYDLLSAIAPTIVIDHSGSTWQELTTIMGEAVGHQQEAEDAIADFDQLVADTAEDVDATYEVSAFVYNPDGANVFTPESAHGQLLESLGYTVHAVPDDVVGDSNLQGSSQRQDVVAISLENTGPAFGDSSLFFVLADDETMQGHIAEDSVLAAVPAVAEQRAFALGPESFRLDWFSATDVVETIGEISAG